MSDNEIKISNGDTFVDGFGVVNERCSDVEWGAAIVRMLGLAESVVGEDLVSNAIMLWQLQYVERVQRVGYDVALDECIRNPIKPEGR